MLKKAFGSDEAVATIKLLMNNASGLTDVINEISKVKNMDNARWKADLLADRQERLNQVNTALKIGFGAPINQALIPFHNSAIDNLSVLNQWISKYPHLLGFITKATTYILGFTAVIAGLVVAKGVAIITIEGLSTGLAI